MIRAVLEGGPDVWNGRVCNVLGGPRIERGCFDRSETEFVIGVWERTDSERDVQVSRSTRAGRVTESKPAVVYRFSEYRRIPKEGARERRLANGEPDEPQQMTFAA